MTGLAEETRRKDAPRRAKVEALPVLEVAHAGAITAPCNGDMRICASVGPDGEVITVWTAATNLAAAQSRTLSIAGATFPDPRPPRQLDVRVTVQGRGGASVTPISGLSLANITAQPLPDGKILIVGARSQWRQDGADRNAVIYDADGNAVSEEVLGDGIAHVLADSAGFVWVGYFDEGIFGNYGWGEADSSEPIGSCGLVRFSPDLRPEWRYPSATSPFGSITDCYALNIDDTTAWACYDDAFPIVRIESDTLTGWRTTGFAGVRALAVTGSEAVLYGGYGADRDRLAIGELHDGIFDLTSEHRVVRPGGADMPARTQVIGRGSCLHFLTDGDWYCLSPDELPAV